MADRRPIKPRASPRRPRSSRSFAFTSLFWLPFFLSFFSFLFLHSFVLHPRVGTAFRFHSGSWSMARRFLWLRLWSVQLSVFPLLCVGLAAPADPPCSRERPSFVFCSSRSPPSRRLRRPGVPRRRPQKHVHDAQDAHEAQQRAPHQLLRRVVRRRRPRPLAPRQRHRRARCVPEPVAHPDPLRPGGRRRAGCARCVGCVGCAGGVRCLPLCCSASPACAHGWQRGRVRRRRGGRVRRRGRGCLGLRRPALPLPCSRGHRGRLGTHCGQRGSGQRSRLGGGRHAGLLRAGLLHAGPRPRRNVAELVHVCGFWPGG